VLIDVVMPEHRRLPARRHDPRASALPELAIIFVSAMQIAETDHLRGYEIGAVDYVRCRWCPKVLRAKVQVFVDSTARPASSRR
jgi:DNA-binding response OmpR family regulator